MKISELITQWIAYRAQLHAAGAIADSTFKTQTRSAGYLSGTLGSHQIHNLRKSHIDIWVATRLKNYARITVHNEMVILKQILRWAIDEKLISDLPRFPTVSVPNTELPLPEDSDFIWYLKRLPSHHSEALEFMLLTGLAPHELHRLQVRDCDWDASTIQIGFRPDFFVKQESRRREIPLNQRALDIWAHWSLGGPADRPVFSYSDSIQKAMRRLFLSSPDAPSKADRLTPKMMRKWFASKVAKESSEALLQRLLGHSPGSKITRKHYVRSTDNERREAMQSIKIGSDR